MHISNYLGLVHHAETNLAEAFRQVSDAHGDEPDVMLMCRTLAKQCDAHAQKAPAFRRPLRRGGRG